MTTLENIARIQEHSALGAYWKTLRRAANLSQDEMVARLRARGLLIAVKQVWSWEKGQHRPTSISKALVDELLHGNPALSDELLIYDLEQAVWLSELAQQAKDSSHPEDVRAQAQAKMDKHAQAVRDYGVATAEAWIQERELRTLAEEHAILPPQVVIQLQGIAVSLHIQSPDLIDEWLRYGRYIASAKEEC
jgi:DNA-binding transcriptional regulator YiaG